MDPDAQGTAAPPLPPAGWYLEPGSSRQRWWDGNLWGQYTPPPAVRTAPPSADPQDGRAIQIVGYVMAGLAIVVPALGVVGLILGIITATKPGRGGHGAAIISISVGLALVGFVFWGALAAAG
jgi:hypothetical protein